MTSFALDTLMRDEASNAFPPMSRSKSSPNCRTTDLFINSSRWKQLGPSQLASLKIVRPNQLFKLIYVFVCEELLPAASLFEFVVKCPIRRRLEYLIATAFADLADLEDILVAEIDAISLLLQLRIRNSAFNPRLPWSIDMMVGNLCLTSHCCW